MKCKILILGAGGQDGKILSRVASARGYKVYGTVRKSVSHNKEFEYLKLQKIRYKKVVNYTIPKIIDLLNEIQPDYVVNFISQSSVGKSFEQPFETFSSAVTINSLFLEAMRIYKRDIRYFYASSGECLGARDDLSDIDHLDFGSSPYAFSKRIATEHIRLYRDKYDIKANIGFFFNHESEFRSKDFVIPKIIRAAQKIRRKELEKLELGNLDIIRDWALAEDYMEALLRFLVAEYDHDVEFATGVGLSVQAVVDSIFEYYSLNSREWISINEHFVRPDELKINIGNPQRLMQACDWQPKYRGTHVINELIGRMERFDCWASY